MIIKNALVYTEDHKFEKKDVRIEDHRCWRFGFKFFNDFQFLLGQKFGFDVVNADALRNSLSCTRVVTC